MEKETYFQQLPSRIRHYLLEWKDDNLEEFCDKYGEQKLRDFSKEQIHDLFSYATTKDSAKLSKINS
jgi:hypothetical protein